MRWLLGAFLISGSPLFVMACGYAMEEKSTVCRYVDVFGKKIGNLEQSYNTPDADAEKVFKKKIDGGRLPFIVIRYPPDHRFAGQIDVPFAEPDYEWKGPGKQEELFINFLSDEKSSIVFDPIYLNHELKGTTDNYFDQSVTTKYVRNCDHEVKTLSFARLFNSKILKLYVENLSSRK